MTRIDSNGFSGKGRYWVLALGFSTALGAVPQPTWAAGPWYVSPAGSDSNDCLSPATACLTITATVTKASSTDTINVAAGTYNEQVTIAKPLTVTGDDGAVLDGTGLAPTWTTGVKIKSGNVTWNNIDVTKFTQDGMVAGYEASTPGSLPNIHITNSKISDIQPGYWGFGIYVGYESEGFGYLPPKLTSHLDYSGLLIEGNEIVNTGSSGVVLQSITGTPGTLVVSNNNIHGITTNDAVWVDCSRELTLENNIVAGNKWGIDFTCIADGGGGTGVLNGAYGPKNIDVRGNEVTDNVGDGIGWYSAWPSTIDVSGNIFQGNGVGAENILAETARASGNWWGSATGPTVASNPLGSGDPVDASVDYSPWLKSAIDSDLGTAGFQPAVPTTYAVNANDSPTYTTGGLQDGVNFAAAGDTVEAVTGTYNETNITVNKSLTITGDPSGPCPGPGPAAPQILGTFTGSERGFIIGSGVDNVTIEGFIVGNMGVVPQTENGGACGVWAYNTLADPTEHITVRNNAFHDVAYTHVFFYNEAQSAYNDIDISCNAIDVGVPDYNGYGGNLTGIECTNCINSTIADNDVSGGQVGVFISAQTATGTTMTAGDLLITGNTISDADFGGIYTVPWSLGGAQPTLQNVSIVDNQLSGYTTAIWVYTSGGSIVSDYSITGNTITITDPTADGDAVYVSSVAGVSNFGGNSVTLAGTAPPSYFRGLDVLGAPTGSWTIRENVFTGGAAAGASGAAVRTRNSLPLTASLAIDCNRIENWPTGLLSESSDALPVVGSNSIQGNSVGVDHTGAGTLNAENNWWGCASGPGNPGCDTVAGSVDASPAATFVPACVSCNSDADCDDTLACTGTETCNLLTNVCTAGTAVVCSGQCETGTCVEPAATCQLETDGAGCDDALFCNGADTCAGGLCSQHAGDPCAAGAECANACDESADNCNVENGTACTDDGLPYTQDACDSGTCVSTVAPAAGCLDAGSSGFSIVDNATDDRDKLRWKWEKGLGTDCAAFGSPGVTTGFDVFVYDGIGGGQYSLSASLHLPAPSGSKSASARNGATGTRQG